MGSQCRIYLKDKWKSIPSFLLLMKFRNTKRHDILFLSRDGFYQWEEHQLTNKGTSGGKALCISACADDQNSADTSVSINVFHLQAKTVCVYIYIHILIIIHQHLCAGFHRQCYRCINF